MCTCFNPKSHFYILLVILRQRQMYLCCDYQPGRMLSYAVVSTPCFHEHYKRYSMENAEKPTVKVKTCFGNVSVYISEIQAVCVRLTDTLLYKKWVDVNCSNPLLPES